MELTHEGVSWKGEKTVEAKSVEQFLYEEILFYDTYRCDKQKVPLEDQPKKVCAALGRFVEILIKKNILDVEDLKKIADCGWGLTADTLAIKMEE